MLQIRLFVKLFLLLSINIFIPQVFASSSDSSKGFDWKSFLQIPERSVEETSPSHSSAKLADSATSSLSTPSQQHHVRSNERQQPDPQQKYEKQARADLREDEHEHEYRKKKRDTQRRYSAKLKSTVGYGSLVSARLGQARKAKRLGLPLDIEDAKLLERENKRQAEYKKRKKQELLLQNSSLKKHRSSNI